VHTERLLKLADLLEQDADNPKGVKFDLGLWATHGSRGKFPDKLEKLDCKTTACAVGLACLSGVFAADGLTWTPDKHDNAIEPIFAGEDGFPAVEAFFGLSWKQSSYLFTDDAYQRDCLPTQGAEAERLVAKRIREMVAKGA
jgi:hypothetical protein